MGESDLQILLGPDGRMLTLKILTKSMMGSRQLEWDFSNYTFPGDVRLSTFRLLEPLGFTPYSVGRLDQPLQRGDEFPVAGWVSATGAASDFSHLAAGKTFVVAYLGDEQGPAGRCKAALSQIEHALPVFIVGVGQYRDPSGGLLRKIGAPGTPLVFLLNPNGKIRQLWFGYDGSDADSFVKDVMAESAAPETPVRGPKH
jgi:hypothetical protein